MSLRMGRDRSVIDRYRSIVLRECVELDAIPVIRLFAHCLHCSFADFAKELAARIVCRREPLEVRYTAIFRKSQSKPMNVGHVLSTVASGGGHNVT
jgi:hypothetical protein